MTRARRIRHQALEAIPEGSSATGLAESSLNDRDRAGLLLQGAALMAHLHTAGWRLESWVDLRVDAGVVLRVDPAQVAPGRDDRLPQAVLRQLVALLFGSEELAGRSAVRAALRPVLAGWRDELLVVPLERMVADVLDHAPFLWDAKFGAARSSLYAVLEDARGERAVVVGHPRWRRSLQRAAGSDPGRQLAILGSDQAQKIWRGGDEAGQSTDWIASGDWRRAVCETPSDPTERSAVARALLDCGRLEVALALVDGSRRTEDTLTRLCCQVRMARMAAARRTLTVLENRRLSGAAALELCELAIRVHAAAGRSAQVRVWSQQALGEAAGPHAERGRAIAALGMWNIGDLDAMASHLGLGGEDDWRSFVARARLALGRGRPEEAEQTMATALRRFGRRLPVYERAALWDELASIRLSATDLAGAERAARVAIRLLRRCDGPASRTEAHRNLAEVRIRTGRLFGVAKTIESLRRESLMAGSVRDLAETRGLEARLCLAQGRWHAALECCRSGLDELSGPRLLPERRRSLRLLSARALVHLDRKEEAAEELSASLAQPVAGLAPSETLPAVYLLAGLRDEARTVAAGTVLSRLWNAVAENRAPGAADWRRVEELGVYRAALTVHELVCLRVNTVPTRLLAAAVRALSEVGADALAQRVAGAWLGPWSALRAFLNATDLDARAYRSLLSAAGHPEARIVVQDTHGGFEEAREPLEVLLDGPGGPEHFSAGGPGGRLVLSAAGIEEPARAMLTLIAERAPVASRRRGDSSELAEARKSAVSGMIGKSTALLAAQTRIEKLAVHDLPVLILGESGTGKELLARQLHRSSGRASQPWLAVNCAALPEGLLLSDLFGHLRGSFTGADRDRIGVFESADGGTVFLDEIAELPWAAQGMLLRILQEGEMRRVGESRPRRLDFRLVSATHRDLSAMVEAGDFREDLYYRLRVANVEAPPLRDRDNDVMLLADHFLDVFTEDRKSLRFSDRARGKILDYSWPGNVRELKNAIEGAAALAEGPEITVEMMGLRADREQESVAEATSYHRKLEEYRRDLIGKALAEAGGNQAQAARALGLSRQALSYLVRKLNYAPLTDR